MTKESMYPGRHMSRKRRSPGHFLLLGLGLFVVLSHVCALPVAAGFATLVGHTHGTHDEPSADESMHGASCEAAVPSTLAGTPPVLPATPAPPVRVVTHIVQRLLDRPLSTFATSPPLFLLHASLLI